MLARLPLNLGRDPWTMEPSHFLGAAAAPIYYVMYENHPAETKPYKSCVHVHTDLYPSTRHLFWDTMNNGTPVLSRKKADCHHSWTVKRAHETNMVHQPRAELVLPIKRKG